RRALREDRVGPVQQRSQPLVFPVADLRRRLLPLQRHVPPRSQAGKSPPRRKLGFEGLRFRTLSRKGLDPTRRFALHALQ
ncbi:hypothetical protein CFP56_042955, partial [Quercus suber]